MRQGGEKHRRKHAEEQGWKVAPDGSLGHEIDLVMVCLGSISSYHSKIRNASQCRARAPRLPSRGAVPGLSVRISGMGRTGAYGLVQYGSHAQGKLGHAALA